MSNAPRRSNREIDMSLANATQIVDQLIAFTNAGRLDPAFIAQRLGRLKTILGEITDARKTASQQDRYARLYEVSRLIGSSLDLQTVLDQVIDALINLTGAERGFLMLLEDGKLNVRVARNFDQETIDRSEFTMSRTITNKVIETGRAILTTNAQADFAGQQSIIGQALSSIMASPLHIDSRVIGVIYVDSRAVNALFAEDDLELLKLFGDQAAKAINNAVEVQQRENVLKDQIKKLQIEIDHARQAKDVEAIAGTDYFKKLSKMAQNLRATKDGTETEDNSAETHDKPQQTQ